MASSEQFSSGLNKWAGSDIPTRLDFVSDNQTLDENAMWKSAYDSEGAVAQGGGIAGFVDAQIQIVNTQVQSAADAAQTFTKTYALPNTLATATAGADALSITSSVKREVEPYDVQFIAPETYNAAKKVVIDGAAVTVRTVDGKDIGSGIWGSGAVVTLSKTGAYAFFKSGGAASSTTATTLNYGVVGGAARPTTGLRENLFWLYTAIPITSVLFYPTTPDAAQGRVWVTTTNTVSDKSFNAISSASSLPQYVYVHPASVWQYVNGRWEYRSTQIYQKGVWKDFDTVYTEGAAGVTCAAGPALSYGLGSVAKTSNAFRLTKAGGAVSYWTLGKQDLTNIRTLNCQLQNNGANPNRTLFGIGDTNNANGAGTDKFIAAANGKLTWSMDVSSYKGAYFLNFALLSDASLDVFKVWGTP